MALPQELLIIRQAQPEDAETIVRFIRELAEYEREPDAVQATAQSIRTQMQQSPPPFECLIAHVGDDPVGFALYFHNYSTWRGQPGMYLEDLYVTPASRGHGIGEALLQRLASLAVERGCGRLEWAVLNWNEPAIRFYRHLGAQSLSEWTVFRLTDEALTSLALGKKCVGANS